MEARWSDSLAGDENYIMEGYISHEFSCRDGKYPEGVKASLVFELYSKRLNIELYVSAKFQTVQNL